MQWSREGEFWFCLGRGSSAELANYPIVLVFQVQGLPRPSSLPRALWLHIAVLARLSSTLGFHYCLWGQSPFRGQNKTRKKINFPLKLCVGFIYDGSCWGVFCLSFFCLFCALYSQICFLNSHRYVSSRRKGKITLKTIAVTCKEGEINEAFITFWVTCLG